MIYNLLLDAFPKESFQAGRHVLDVVQEAGSAAAILADGTAVEGDLVIVPAGRPPGWAVIATMPPTPADTAAIAKAPTVMATGRKRLRAGGDIPAAPTGCAAWEG